MEEDYESLKLGNQLCFPLYACAKEVVRHYKPHLDKLDLTYTQYITMMVLWEFRSLNVKELGEKLYLDSGTLTPVLKKLESKGFITRERSEKDERNLLVTITRAGENLRSQAVGIPSKMSACANITSEEAQVLYKLLYKLLGNISDAGTDSE